MGFWMIALHSRFDGFYLAKIRRSLLMRDMVVDIDQGHDFDAICNFYDIKDLFKIDFVIITLVLYFIM